jgi:hypothetical protein
MLKWVERRVTEFDIARTIARLHKSNTIGRVSTQELYVEITRHCSIVNESVAAIEVAWTIPATFWT